MRLVSYNIRHGGLGREEAAVPLALLLPDVTQRLVRIDRPLGGPQRADPLRLRHITSGGRDLAGGSDNRLD